jgi:anti-sigma regulatory factor (Ser/Thr protein kinase)
MRVTEQFPRRSDQIPRARALVRTTLRSWGVDARLDDLLLVASELFTNAVLHGDGPVEMSLERRTGTVRLEVVDGGHPEARVPLVPVEPGMFSGRGLAIVAKVAADWGSAVAAHGGTRVWAEITC